MRNWSGLLGMRPVLMAEALGLEMARKAAQILDQHREMLTENAAQRATEPAGGAADGESADEDVRSAQFIADDAIFTSVLDAANECLGRFDDRPAEDRWCDALVQLLALAESAPPQADYG